MDERKYVSARELIPLLEEQLALGKRVNLTVTGASMTPWLIHGRDSVELVSARGLKLKKGDIILFSPLPGRYILHRITGLAPGGFVTTGDGNRFRDGAVPAENVIAKAVVLHRKGRMIDCGAFRWSALARVWMALYPVRGPMLRLAGSAARLKDKIKRP